MMMTMMMVVIIKAYRRNADNCDLINYYSQIIMIKCLCDNTLKIFDCNYFAAQKQQQKNKSQKENNYNNALLL